MVAIFDNSRKAYYFILIHVNWNRCWKDAYYIKKTDSAFPTAYKNDLIKIVLLWEFTNAHFCFTVFYFFSSAMIHCQFYVVANFPLSLLYIMERFTCSRAVLWLIVLSVFPSEKKRSITKTAADLARIFSNTHLKSNLNFGDLNVSWLLLNCTSWSPSVCIKKI